MISFMKGATNEWISLDKPSQSNLGREWSEERWLATLIQLHVRILLYELNTAKRYVFQPHNIEMFCSLTTNAKTLCFVLNVSRWRSVLSVQFTLSRRVHIGWQLARSRVGAVCGSLRRFLDIFKWAAYTSACTARQHSDSHSNLYWDNVVACGGHWLGQSI